MASNQVYPFERNRYYPGKMLTTADFQAEQSYHINKLRFMNSLMYSFRMSSKAAPDKASTSFIPDKAKPQLKQ